MLFPARFTCTKWSNWEIEVFNSIFRWMKSFPGIEITRWKEAGTPQWCTWTIPLKNEYKNDNAIRIEIQVNLHGNGRAIRLTIQSIKGKTQTRHKLLIKLTHFYNDPFVYVLQWNVCIFKKSIPMFSSGGVVELW